MKKVILIAAGCFGLLLLAGIVFFGLFGTLELNGQCNFRGLLASPTEGACIKEDANVGEEIGNSKASTYEGRLSADIGMAVPENYFLDESSEDISFIFSKDPETIQPGDFVPNLNIIASEDYLEFTALVCKNLVDASIEELKPYYDSLTESSGRIFNINGVTSCVTEWNGVLDGVALYQKQFIVPSKSNNTMYYLTLTTNDQKEELNQLEDIVKSLKLK